MFFVILPEFKPGFKYSNIGMAIGTLVYSKDMTKKDGTPFGTEFLINSQGFGSVNVRVPKVEKAQATLDKYSVSEKPRVRVGMTEISQFTTDQGKTYTNLTSFLEFEEPLTVSGEDMPDSIKGRIGGEAINIRMDGNIIKFQLVSYKVDKDGNLFTTKDGRTFDPEVINLEIHKPELIEEFKQNVTEGSNIEVGYDYINKEDITYDEYGFPIGSGDKIERVEVGKLIVHSKGNGGQQMNTNPFASQQPAQPTNQQQNPFAQQSQTQPMQQPQQQQAQQNPFAGGQELPQNDPVAQQAQNIFGQTNAQNGGFTFGK